MVLLMRLPSEPTHAAAQHGNPSSEALTTNCTAVQFMGKASTKDLWYRRVLERQHKHCYPHKETPNY